jgi:hypothetical protein
LFIFFHLEEKTVLETVRDQGLQALRKEAYIRTPQRRRVKRNFDVGLFTESARKGTNHASA